MGLKLFIDKLLNQGSTATLETNEATETTDAIIDEMVAEVRGDSPSRSYYNTDIRTFSKYKEFKGSKPEVKRLVLLRAVDRLLEYDVASERSKEFDSEAYFKRGMTNDLIAAIMRSALPLEDGDYDFMIKAFKGNGRSRWGGGNYYPVKATLKHLEKKAKKVGISTELVETLNQAADWKSYNYDSKEGIELKTILNQIRAISTGNVAAVAPLEFSEDDAFGAVANATFKTVKNKDAWYSIMHLTMRAKSSKPSQKFLDEIRKHIDVIGEKTFVAEVGKWLKAYNSTKVESKTTTYTHSGNEYSYNRYVFLLGNNAQMMKGVLWTLLVADASEYAGTITKVAEHSFRKIPGQGPAAAAVGNAAIYVLANIDGLLGLSYMSRLKLKIRQNNTQRLIQSNIDKAAEKLGITPLVAEEICVPDFGFNAGVRLEEFENFTLNITLDKAGKPELKWISDAGKEQKSPPALVKNSDLLKEQLKNIKAELKEVQKVFSAQKYRIDRMFKQDREWEYNAFMERYIQHGLVSLISAKMLWRFKIDGAWKVLRHNGTVWVDVADAVVEIPAENTPVRMWHPIDSTVDEVLAWREKLSELEISQPVKQAYRELYLLTDAEVNTKSYSNRMAAHIIKQHQFNVLTSLRGWKYSLLGAYDDGRSGEIAKTDLREHGLSAEFWVDEVNADDAWTESGIWQYVATDQVRFMKGSQVIDLSDVPAIVFSEIMRDVDLFVGVCSVGNDPLWQDSGGLPQFRDYWTSYSFGELSEVAKTRKDVLEKLLPRLKIKHVATIDGRFLRVKGTVREYKIHLGSTNILMEPNDQYLCIVPDRKADKNVDKVFLPFEGDRGLSLIISKAFLLAADDKIKDATILSQIKR